MSADHVTEGSAFAAAGDSGDQGGRTGLRVLVSFVSGAGNTVIVAALGAFAIRIITTHVGPHDYGFLVTGLTFITTAMLISDLGITSITGREIAKRPDDAAHILGHNLGLRLTIGVVMIPVLAGLGLVAYQGKPGELLLMIVILTAAVPFDALRATSLGYYVASIRTYYGAAITLLQQVLYVTGVTVSIYTGNGIIGCAVSYLAATVVGGVIAYVVTRRELTFRPLFDRREWQLAIRASISLGAILVVNVLYLRADMLLLGRMAAPRLVGLYGVAYSFITFFSVVPSLLGTSLLPMFTRADGTELSALVRRGTQLLAFSGVLFALGTLLFAPQAISVLSGPRFLGATTSLRILSVATIFTFLNTSLGYAAVAKNRHHRIIVVSVIGLVLNVVLNVIAIPRWGIVGSAYATLASEVVALVGIRYVYSRDVDVGTSLIASTVRPVLVAAVIGVVGHFVLVTGSATIMLLWAPVVVLAYVCLLALLRGLPPDIVNLPRTARDALSRRRTAA